MLPLALLVGAGMQAGFPPALSRLSTLEAATGWQLDEQGVRTRDLQHLPGRDVQLFDGTSLTHWHAIGTATFRADDASILGQTATGTANSFLVSDDSYGDFLLTLELKNEQPGNSGIQIRSRVVGEEPKTSYASGYQIEIDPSARAWSGGLYEEKGRGWLQNLEQNEAGRKAFHPGQWNRYRIECIGPWIRAWINEVPTADAFDPGALEGILGLQVHAGQDTRVRFRAFQMHVFGRHRWNAIDQKTFVADGAKLGNDLGLRLVRTPEASALSLAGWRLCFRGEDTSKRAGRSSTSASELVLAGSSCWSIALDDARLANAKESLAWQELTLLAYADRVVVHRDQQLVAEVRGATGADGQLAWIERPSSASEVQPFARVESLEPATR